MKLIDAKAVVEYKAPQQGALMMFVPAMRVKINPYKSIDLTNFFARVFQ